MKFIKSLKVKIDPEGNVVAQGVITAKALQLDDTSASPSVGIATISAGQTSTVVTSAQFSGTAHLFATPYNYPVAISKKRLTDTSFELDITSALVHDLQLDWWVIK